MCADLASSYKPLEPQPPALEIEYVIAGSEEPGVAQDLFFRERPGPDARFHYVSGADHFSVLYDADEVKTVAKILRSN